jgi:hypothetical protein
VFAKSNTFEALTSFPISSYKVPATNDPLLLYHISSAMQTWYFPILRILLSTSQVAGETDPSTYRPVLALIEGTTS